MKIEKYEAIELLNSDKMKQQMSFYRYLGENDATIDLGYNLQNSFVDEFCSAGDDSQILIYRRADWGNDFGLPISLEEFLETDLNQPIFNLLSIDFGQPNIGWDRSYSLFDDYFEKKAFMGNL